MTPVLSIGTLKTSGTSTLALTLAAVGAAADIPVVLIDAARDGDLADWSHKSTVPAKITVERARDIGTIERLVRAARRRGDIAIIDAGDEEATIRAGAMLADRALIPVRFFAAVGLFGAGDRPDPGPGTRASAAASATAASSRAPSRRSRAGSRGPSRRWSRPARPAVSTSVSFSVRPMRHRSSSAARSSPSKTRWRRGSIAPGRKRQVLPTRSAFWAAGTQTARRPCRGFRSSCHRLPEDGKGFCRQAPAFRRMPSSMPG